MNSYSSKFEQLAAELKDNFYNLVYSERADVWTANARKGGAQGVGKTPTEAMEHLLAERTKSPTSGPKSLPPRRPRHFPSPGKN